MPWQRWLSLAAGLISLGVIAWLVVVPVTMESLETTPLWLAVAILYLAVAVGAELHHHHVRLTGIEKDRNG